MFKFEIKLKTIVQVALLVAMEVVLNRFASINTESLKIGFSFLPIALCGLLFGPIWASIAGGLADFLGAILFPIGPYHVGFTIVAAVMGAVYGLFLYKRETPRFFPNIFCPAIINTLVLGLFVNTLWVSQLYSSQTYWGFFMFRMTTQYIFLIPVYLLLLPLLPRLASAIRKAGLAE
ncbi:MAG: folate family ECF transporter S component [Oscillospiraceae bacterium]|jgi:ECF transporter S component (folate family)|nr:folate family ECF transporter S component [Oscillospiraceae bacterium]